MAAHSGSRYFAALPEERLRCAALPWEEKGSLGWTVRLTGAKNAGKVQVVVCS